jgi:hypothetical protein
VKYPAKGQSTLTLEKAEQMFFTGRLIKAELVKAEKNSCKGNQYFSGKLSYVLVTVKRKDDRYFYISIREGNEEEGVLEIMSSKNQLHIYNHEIDVTQTNSAKR